MAVEDQNAEVWDEVTVMHLDLALGMEMKEVKASSQLASPLQEGIMGTPHILRVQAMVEH